MLVCPDVTTDDIVEAIMEKRAALNDQVSQGCRPANARNFGGVKVPRLKLSR